MPPKKSKPSKKKVTRKAPAKKRAHKAATGKKTPAKTIAKKKTPTKKAAVAKKVARKKATSKKKAPAKKVAKKKTPTKRRTPAKPSSKTPVRGKSAPARKTKIATAKKSDRAGSAVVSRESEASTDKPTPIVFSPDDLVEVMAAKQSATTTDPQPTKKAFSGTANQKTSSKKKTFKQRPAKKRKLGPASLTDILGFNPTEKQKRTDLNEDEIPKKWKKYYKLLIELRAHVSDEIDLHTSETLKHSSREDSGNLSNYGNHQADAGTDTFDRDFALSLVSSEQEALNEIEEAILRIKDGSYGVCDITGKSIPAARLRAVPFTRYSVKGQVEYEKNLRRKPDLANPGGLFADSADAPKISSSDDDDA